MAVIDWLGMMLGALALVGCAYQIYAAAALARFFARPSPLASRPEAVTILKPLHGDEPKLSANLATFLDQNYHAPVQLLCGVRDAQDPAAGVVRRLQAEQPDGSIELVVDPRRHGSNAKISNLINLLTAARHEIIVMSDSDMAVDRNYLETVVASLGLHEVGAVTCLYRGRADAGLWSQLASGTISYSGLPDMIIGLTTGLARPCMGSTIALRRSTLEEVGGLPLFADVLADDYAIGRAVAGSGLRVAVPPLLLVHACAEDGPGTLWRHELRWAATIRNLHPAGYAGSIVTNPLPLALVACAFSPLRALPVVLLSLGARCILARRVDRVAGARTAPLWMLPLIDCLKFAVFLASTTVTTVDWRGASYTMIPGGGITTRKADDEAHSFPPGPVI